MVLPRWRKHWDSVVFCCLLTGLGNGPVRLVADDSQGESHRDLLAEFRFESVDHDKLVDASGRSSGQIHGEAQLAPGKSGQALQLKGQGFLDLPGSDQWLFPDGLAIEAWICPEVLVAGRIVDRATPASSDGFCLDTHPGNSLRFISPAGTINVAQVLAAGQWTHAIAVYDPSVPELALYVDGKLAAVQPCGRVLAAPAKNAFHIGSDPQGANRFSGRIDELRLYRRPLYNTDATERFEGREPTAVRAEVAPAPIFYRREPQVDYPALLARNDVVYLSPAVHEHESLPIGNGRLCAMVWNADGLNLQLNHAENVWYQQASARVTIRTEPSTADPKLPRGREGEVPAEPVPAHGAAGASPSQSARLSLYDGTVRVQSPSSAGPWQATVTVLDKLDAVAIHLQGKLPTPDLRVDLDHWRPAVQPVATASAIGFVEDLVVREAEQFSGTMAVLVRADCPATTTPPTRDGERLRASLRVTPARDPDGTFHCTVYVANIVVRRSETALAVGAQVLEDALREGWPSLATRSAARWARFWERSFLQLRSSDGTADYMENLWYLHLYWMGCGGEGPLAVKFNGGPFLMHRDSRSWGTGYWYQNTRELYWPLPAANQLELCRGLQRLYLSTVAAHRKHARELFGKQGLQVQETMLISGEGDKRGNPYTFLYLSTGLECALQLYHQASYARDDALLRDEVLPLLKEAVDFYQDYATLGADRQYHIAPEDARETYWRVQDGMTSLSALREGLPILIRESQRLGVFSDLQPRWQEFLEHLAPLPAGPDGTAFAPCVIGPTIPASDNPLIKRLYPPQNTSTRLDKRFNSENPELDCIYPFGLAAIGTANREQAIATYQRRVFAGSSGWDWSAICAARLGLADEAARLQQEHCRHSQHWPQGFWDSPAGPYWANGLVDCPYFDSSGVNATTTTEMLLQSHGGGIRVWPAAPVSWEGGFRLRAETGFLVTSERAAGQVRYLALESLFGDVCRVVNPWDDSYRVLDQDRTIGEGRGAEIVFPTEAGRTYLVERVAAPVREMACQTLAPARNDDVKYLGNPRRARRPMTPTPGQPMLGITRDGLTPPRAAAQQNRLRVAAAIESIVHGKPPLRASRASWLDEKESPSPAPWLSDGVCGASTIPTPRVAARAWLLELPASRSVTALVWSYDRNGERYDANARFSEVQVDGSPDGKAWQPLAKQAAHSAELHGQVLALREAQEIRFVRLRFLDASGPVACCPCDEIELY